MLAYRLLKNNLVIVLEVLGGYHYRNITIGMGTDLLD